MTQWRALLERGSLRGDRARAASDALWVAGLSAANTASLGVVAVVTARELGADDRGIVVLTVTAATLAMLLSSAGANYAGRVLLVARRPVAQEHYNGTAALLCLLAVPLGTAATSISYRLSGTDRPWSWYLAFGLYTAQLLAVYLAREALAAHGGTRLAARLELVGGGVQLVLVLTLLYGLSVRSAGPVLAALLAAAGFQLVVAWRSFGVHGLTRRVAWRGESALALLRHGRRGIGIGLAQALAQRFDRIVIGAALSSSAVGVYSVAVTFTEFLWFVPMALGQVLSARVAMRRIEATELRWFRLGNLALAATLALLVGWVGPTVVDVVFGPAFGEAHEPLRVLLLASVAAASYHVDILCLNATGRTGTAGAAAVLGGVVVVLLNLLVIPRSGLVGAAWCSVAGYASMAALAAWALHRAVHSGDVVSEGTS